MNLDAVLVWLGPIFSALSVILLAVLLWKLRSSERARIENAIREEMRLGRDESARAARELREEVSAALKQTTETMVMTIAEMGKAQKDQFKTVADRIKVLTESNESRIEKLRNTVDAQLSHIRESNEKELDQMRRIVDEKLQSSLEKRLGESFKMVSRHLEAVQRGLGEMQNLAVGVGDLRRVLTNVKTRGTWGEVQLGALLEQILTPDQYARNVRTRESSGETVEYAIRLPGPADNPDACVWLPIDAKFPQEDYLRMLDAAEAAEPEAVQRAGVALERALHLSARDIHDKYLNPPKTTDFAIMFLPTEGLYAEILRRPGQVEELQRKHRVVVAGPTTLSAVLSSLRMGFRTLAIEKRSSEVWKILGAVKTEFARFGDVLTKVKRQLTAASNTIELTGARTRAMERKLREVEQLPADASAEILELPESDVEKGLHKAGES